MRYLIGRNVLKAIPLGEIQRLGPTIPLFTKGEYPDGRKAPQQGITPTMVLYVTDAAGQKVTRRRAVQLRHRHPHRHQRRYAGHPPRPGQPQDRQLGRRPQPGLQGRAAIQDNPTIGIIDIAMAMEARGDLKYGDKGNMTKAEIDKTIDTMLATKRSGQFRSFWSSFDQSVNLMASGEVVIQSMWSPAVAAVRSRGIACTFQPLKEGYRGWGYTLGLMKHVDGLETGLLLRVYELVFFRFPRFVHRPPRLLLGPAGHRPELPDGERVRLLVRRQAGKTDILSPFGKIMEKAGNVRDGGGLWDRLGNIAVWNSVMDEDRYLTRRWNEFITS